ncbi:MAG: hypothetical protein ABIT76_04965 [Chthoniobacterales bacterium]
MSPHFFPTTFSEMFKKLGNWQTGLISLLIHLMLIVLLGETIFYQATKEPEDFSAQGG